MWREDKLPLVDFYQLCSKKASRLGYEIIICLIARYSDVPEIYENLERQWSSLHDVTGKSILFLFAGDNVDNYVDSATVLYEDCRNSEQAVIYSDTLAIMPSYNNNLLKMNLGSDCYLENLKKGIPRLKKGHDISTSHTIQISQLKEFLNLKEKDIPCLHIHYLEIKINKTIILDANTNIYQILKFMQKEFEDNNIIAEIRKYLNEVNRINCYLIGLERQSSNVQEKSNSKEQIFEWWEKIVCELQIKDKAYFESLLQEILALENRENNFLFNKNEYFQKVKTIGEILNLCDDFLKIEKVINAFISKVKLEQKIAYHQEKLNKQQKNLDIQVTKYTEIIKKLSETFLKESQIQQKQNIVTEQHNIRIEGGNYNEQIGGNYIQAQQVIIIEQPRTTLE